MAKKLELDNIVFLNSSRSLDFYYDMSSFVILGFIAGIYNHLIVNDSERGEKINYVISQLNSLDIFIYISSFFLIVFLLLQIVSLENKRSSYNKDGFLYRVACSLFNLGVVSGVASSLFLYSFSLGVLCHGYWSESGNIINSASQLAIFSIWFLLTSLLFVYLRLIIIYEKSHEVSFMLLWISLLALLCSAVLGYNNNDKLVGIFIVMLYVSVIITVLYFKENSLSYVLKDIEGLAYRFKKLANGTCIFHMSLKVYSFLELVIVLMINLSGWLIKFIINIKYFLLYLLFAGFYSFIYNSNTIFEPSLSWVDSIYLSFVVITTLGFGDVLPSNDISKIIVISEVVIGVLLIGLFLNSLSHMLGEKIRRQKIKIDNNRKEELRLSLEKHSCLLLYKFFDNYFYLKNKPLSYYGQYENIKNQVTFIRTLGFFSKGFVTLNIYSIVDEARKDYPLLLSMTPIAAGISSEHLMEWSELVTAVRSLSEKNINKEYDENASSNDYMALEEDLLVIARVSDFLSKKLP
ncbi:two pore domain potassium channel family protein [Cobetia sp. UIB-001]|uniref:potassium channel family protein n=1 Tax=Cobetia sp. UIB-001 TaxID=2717697 RepID=UPI00384F971F